MFGIFNCDSGKLFDVFILVTLVSQIEYSKVQDVLGTSRLAVKPKSQYFGDSISGDVEVC